jgi:hypothetical protein
MFFNNKDDISYHRTMIGWFIEIYQGTKFLSTSIIAVFQNDNSEVDTGICQQSFPKNKYIKQSTTY